MNTDTGSSRTLNVEMRPQPTDTTCGPTCLSAVYRYYGDEVPLETLIAEVVPLTTGGTLAVWLGNHALKRGYRATIYTCNLQVFDPSWFAADEVDLAEKLRAQAAAKEDAKLREASDAHLQFLDSGGELVFGQVTPDCVYDFLDRDIPLLTGLSATFLYASPREHLDKPNDILGTPVGHFVVLCGSDVDHNRVLVADPFEDKARNPSLYYWVDAERLTAAILLGVLTYDASVLAIEPR